MRHCVLCSPAGFIKALIFSSAILYNLAISYADTPSGTKRSDGIATKSRTFHFTYELKVVDVSPDALVRIWSPVPPSNEDQSAEIVSHKLPSELRISREPKYGNQILYMEGKPAADGSLAAQIVYRIVRHEVRSDSRSPAVSKEEAESFLNPDRRVPVSGRAISLLAQRSLPTDQMKLARSLYDIVNEHMTYSKQGTGWGNGDSVWACDSKYGNCSDFHSLFISLARSQRIPAKFEMGFPLPPERGQGEIPGYHCWAKFKPDGRGWVPVDISEANKVKSKDPDQVAYYFGNLTEDRVTFSTGRDLTLVPPQAGPPLNFLVYPYAEINGNPVPAEKLQRKFTFADQ